MSNIDKIRQEIERRKKEHMYDEMPITIGRYYEDRDLLAFIDLLLQEKPTCKTCGFYENNCPFIRGKLIPYPNKVCKDYIHSVMKEQEQPEEDLEKAVEGEVHHCMSAHYVATNENQLAEALKRFNDGDKVKIIIVKED